MKRIIPLILGALVWLNGCASAPGQGKSSEQLAATGPTVVDTRTNPGTFELNQTLYPTKRAQVIADVKDFQNQVTDVRLRFLHIPMELPMQNVAGSSWQVDLSPEQLRQLAVSGKTMRYEANVIARNEMGQTAISESPVTIAVKAPEVAQPTGSSDG